MWSKMLKYNVNGKCLSLIKNIYANIKSCISANDEFSEYFACDKGVRQGENLSPVLFSLFLNDLYDYFHESNKVHGIICNQHQLDNTLFLYLKLFMLLYADDTVIFSESAADLQCALTVHVYADYCILNKLTVNTEKTKVVILLKELNANMNLHFKTISWKL